MEQTGRKTEVYRRLRARFPSASLGPGLVSSRAPWALAAFPCWQPPSPPAQAQARAGSPVAPWTPHSSPRVRPPHSPPSAGSGLFSESHAAAGGVAPPGWAWTQQPLLPVSGGPAALWGAGGGMNKDMGAGCRRRRLGWEREDAGHLAAASRRRAADCMSPAPLPPSCPPSFCRGIVGWLQAGPAPSWGEVGARRSRDAALCRLKGQARRPHLRGGGCGCPWPRPGLALRTHGLPLAAQRLKAADQSPGAQRSGLVLGLSASKLWSCERLPWAPQVPAAAVSTGNGPGERAAVAGAPWTHYPAAARLAEPRALGCPGGGGRAPPPGAWSGERAGGWDAPALGPDGLLRPVRGGSPPTSAVSLGSRPG